MNKRIQVLSALLIGCYIVQVQAAELKVPSEYVTIQAAIDAAGDGDVILVADGAYTGDGNRDIDFDGKKITVRSQNGATNCIIDSQGSDGDAHRGFVLNSGEDPNLSVIDGFTITNGYLTEPGDWRGRGSGIYCYDGGMTVRNCILTGNTAANGGTIYGESATITIENCSIIGNTALASAGIKIRSAKVTVQNCIIEDNIATPYSAGGFSIQDGVGCSLISDCTFQGNVAENDTGAISIDATDVTISNCEINDNSAGDYGGGLKITACDDIDILNCTITGNTVGSAMSGGGIYCNASNLNLSYCNISENDGGDYGGAIESYNCNMTIDNCIFYDNHVDYLGGALRFASGSNNVLATNCIFQGNSVLYQHGGAVHSIGADLSMTNCLFTGNQCGWNGGAVFFDAGDPVFTNCTLCGNRSNEREWGGIYITNDDPVLTNCIAWNNSGTSRATQEAQFHGGTGTPDVNNCCVQGWDGSWGGVGNIGSDPDFIDPGSWDDNGTPADLTDDTWVIGRYFLSPGSDCINSGDNSAVVGVDTDLVGHDRILNDTVDRGAYENDPEGLIVGKATVKAGKTREAQADSFSVSGTTNAEATDFSAAETVTLRVGDFSETLNCDDFKQAGKHPKYTYKGPSGGITSITLDFNKGTFRAAGKDLILTGTTAPMLVLILIGDFYGAAFAEDQGANDVINGKKSVPVQLLLGDTDYLKTTKVKCKQGNENQVGKLAVQGVIAVEEIVDLRTTGLTIHWGAQQYVLQGGDFTAKGTNTYVGKVKPSGGDNSSAAVTIDFNKCTFKVTLKNTDMTWQASPVNFGLEFDSFNEQENVEF